MHIQRPTDEKSAKRDKTIEFISVAAVLSAPGLIYKIATKFIPATRMEMSEATAHYVQSIIPFLLLPALVIGALLIGLAVMRKQSLVAAASMLATLLVLAVPYSWYKAQISLDMKQARIDAAIEIHGSLAPLAEHAAGGLPDLKQHAKEVGQDLIFTAVGYSREEADNLKKQAREAHVKAGFRD